MTQSDSPDQASQQRGPKGLKERIGAQVRQSAPDQGAGSSAERDQSDTDRMHRTEDHAESGGAYRRCQNEPSQGNRWKGRHFREGELSLFQGNSTGAHLI